MNPACTRLSTAGKRSFTAITLLAAPEGMQEALVEAAPEHYFRPPYVGHRGWLGVMLHGKVDWDEVAGIVEDAFATVAPRKLLA
jgi:hypothetical protein